MYTWNMPRYRADYEREQALAWYVTHCWHCKRDGIYLLEIHSCILDMTVCLCRECAAVAGISDPRLKEAS